MEPLPLHEPSHSLFLTVATTGFDRLFESLEDDDRGVRVATSRLIVLICYKNPAVTRYIYAQNGFTTESHIRVFSISEKFQEAYENFLEQWNEDWDILTFLHTLVLSFPTTKSQYYWTYPEFVGGRAEYPDPRDYMIGIPLYDEMSADDIANLHKKPSLPVRTTGKKARGRTPSAARVIPRPHTATHPPHANQSSFKQSQSQRPTSATVPHYLKPEAAPRFRPYSASSLRSSFTLNTSASQQPPTKHGGTAGANSTAASAVLSTSTSGPVKKSRMVKEFHKSMEKAWQQLGNFDVRSTLNLQLGPSASSFKFRSFNAQRRLLELRSESTELTYYPMDPPEDGKVVHVEQTAPTKSGPAKKVKKKRATSGENQANLSMFSAKKTLERTIHPDEVLPDPGIARLSHVESYESPYKNRPPGSAGAALIHEKDEAAVEKSARALLLDFQHLLIEPSKVKADVSMSHYGHHGNEEEDSKPFVFAAPRANSNSGKFNMDKIALQAELDRRKKAASPDKMP
jgi:hypothetical protein